MSNNNFYNKIKDAFNKAAQNYNANSVLQQEVGTRLIERLEFFSIKPETILDLGMGTGLITEKLCETYPDADVIGLDFAESMLKIANKNKYQLVCGDINLLPIADNSIDLVFSNFSFQWARNISELFTECHRVLKNNGLLIFSIPGPNTLYELRAVLNQIDPQYDHVNNFIDMHNIGDILVQNKFAHPVMDNDEFTLTYSNILNLIKDIKKIGANVKLTHNYRSSLLGKNKLQKLYQAFEKFKLVDNTYPSTFEVIYGHAFKLKKPVKVKYPEINGIIETAIPIDQIKSNK